MCSRGSTRHSARSNRQGPADKLPLTSRFAHNRPTAKELFTQRFRHSGCGVCERCLQVNRWDELDLERARPDESALAVADAGLLRTHYAARAYVSGTTVAAGSSRRNAGIYSTIRRARRGAGEASAARVHVMLEQNPRLSGVRPRNPVIVLFRRSDGCLSREWKLFWYAWTGWRDRALRRARRGDGELKDWPLQ